MAWALWSGLVNEKMVKRGNGFHFPVPYAKFPLVCQLQNKVISWIPGLTD